MHLPMIVVLHILPAITVAESSPPAAGEAQPRQQQHLEAISSFKAQKPMPTSALLARVLAEPTAGRSVLEDVEEAYGDLGGEKPVAKDPSGIWWLLGWRERRVREATERDELRADLDIAGDLEGTETEEAKIIVELKV